MPEIFGTSTENQKPIINKQEEAKKLLKKVKDSGNYELRYRMIQEYKKSNYAKVKDIFTQTTKKDLKKLSSEKNISYKKYLEIKNAKQSLEKSTNFYSKAEDSSVKSIFEIGKVKYEQAMGYISTFGEVKVSEKDVLTSFQDLKELNKTQLNEKQRILIEEILGTNEGFNNEYLQGFNKEKGNYLIKINEFENKYKNTENIQDLNSLELGNYIKYLSKKNDNKSIKIINEIRIKLGSDTKFFDKENNNIKKFISDKFNEIENTFNTFIKGLFNFDNIDTFIENFKGNSKIEQKEIINHLKNGLENYKQDFINSIIRSLPNKYNKQEKEKIANIFVKNIINTTEINNIILKIYTFQKKYNIKTNIGRTLNNVGKIQEINFKLKASEAIHNGNIEIAKEIIKKAKKNQDNFKKTSTLNSTQMSTLIQGLQNGESFDNIIQEIAQDNEELKKILEKKKSNPGVENKGDEKKEDNNKYYIDKDDYIKSDSGYTIKLENGEKIPGLIITQEERDQTIGNPEGLKNLVNFYKFFKDLNLEGVWKYRKQLALSMGNVNINLNDNDSVSEVELLKFGKKLIQVINTINPGIENKLSENIGNLNALKSELRIYSGANSDLSNNQTYNIQGEDRFTASLREYGIIGGASFHTMQLRKLMK